MSLSANEIEVSRSIQVSIAVETAKDVARKLGFSKCDQTKIAIATSELARNILLHTRGKGKIIINSIKDPDRVGIIVIAEDKGPGIANIEQALHGINSSKTGLGIGLGGAKRLMDEFNVESELGKGTTIIAKKWKSNYSSRGETNYCL